MASAEVEHVFKRFSMLFGEVDYKDIKEVLIEAIERKTEKVQGDKHK